MAELSLTVVPTAILSLSAVASEGLWEAFTPSIFCCGCDAAKMSTIGNQATNIVMERSEHFKMDSRLRQKATALGRETWSP